MTSAQPAAHTVFMPRRRTHYLWLAPLALALSGACADTPSGGVSDEERHHVSDKTKPENPSTVGPSKDKASGKPLAADPATAAPGQSPADAAKVPAALLHTLTEDLATRQSVSPTDIALVQAQAVNWPDSALGCPQPGMGYMQVITPGYRVVLQASGRQFSYHTNQRGYFVLCKQSVSSGRAVQPRDDT